MRSYPLYDELKAKVEKDKERYSVDLKLLDGSIKNISELEKEERDKHYEEIMALIHHYELTVNNGTGFSSIPFRGNSLPGGKGVTWQITSLPFPLQRILAAYVEKYSS